MEAISLDHLTRFIGKSVLIAIHDDQGEPTQAPAVNKWIKKIQLCPDQTHIRFYFDDFYFLAVPLSSRMTETEQEWSAFDEESGLIYTLKL